MFSGNALGVVALTALGLAVDVSPADAVEAQVARPKGETPVAVATRTVEPIRIDGNLDEAAWRSAVPMGPLTQRDPLEGRAATELLTERVLAEPRAVRQRVAAAWRAEPLSLDSETGQRRLPRVEPWLAARAHWALRTSFDRATVKIQYTVRL
jgi:hypothetical protein